MNAPSIKDLNALLRACFKAGMTHAKVRLEMLKAVPDLKKGEGFKQFSAWQRVEIFTHFTELLERWNVEILFPSQPDPKWTQREQYILERHRSAQQTVEGQKEDYCMCAYCVTIVHTHLVESGKLACCPLCHGYRFEADYRRMNARLHEMDQMTDEEVVYWATLND